MRYERETVALVYPVSEAASERPNRKLFGIVWCEKLVPSSQFCLRTCVNMIARAGKLGGHQLWETQVNVHPRHHQIRAHASPVSLKSTPGIDTGSRLGITHSAERPERQ